jgi:hypothetical protein
MLEQILFLYEDSFSYEFAQIFSDYENKFCLAYQDNPYGRTFFNTLLKFVDMLGKKGCYKAALEYNKFLIKLNPLEDPIGGLLFLDYNCLSS